jgi:hypothetical protein
MALTALQRHVCRVLAEHRKRLGESYVAGASALNEMIASARRSHDIDLFHDTEAALVATWANDRAVLQAAGLRVEPLRELPAFVEARVGDPTATVLVQWARDSAFRFFPLVEHDVFGLALHPFDLATNKLLALVGRREPRDWIDIVECHGKVQSLGYLAWAAAGKDPGFSPLRIVEECARTRYVQSEIDSLDFDGPTPRAADVSSRWHGAVDDARELVSTLPVDEVGKCVLDHRGGLQSASLAELAGELAAGRVAFHEGRIRGAFPEVRLPLGPS